MIGLLVVALSAGGFGFVDFILVVLFAITLPWTVIGFWNATIGFLIMRLARDPVATLRRPQRDHRQGADPGQTAILVCIRNEDAAERQRSLAEMIAGTWLRPALLRTFTSTS